MVERIYRRDAVRVLEDSEPVSESELDEPVKQLFPKVKRCSFCKGSFDKGVEIVQYNTMFGYKGTFCSYECSNKFREGGGDAEKDYSKKSIG